MGNGFAEGYKWLEVVRGGRGGRPTVKGTRVSVDDISEVLANGWSVEEVAENYRIPIEAVHKVLRYASETIRRIEVIATGAAGR